MLTAIVHATIDDRPLSDDERVALAQMILVAGNDTTVNGIGTVLRHLAEHPALRKELAADASKIEAVIDECLRLQPPVFGLSRTVCSATELSGVEFHEGDRVLMLFASGNRDESKFPDADTFDLARRHTRDLTFGYGRHRCIGEGLAKLEIEIVVEELLREIPDFHLEPNVEIRERNDLLNGPLSVPVVWSAADGAAHQ
jgi:cytochrome P450